MSKSSNSSRYSICVLGLLGVAFVVLKLTGVINWSWWWVAAPIWGALAIFVYVVVRLVVVARSVDMFPRR